MSTMKKRIPMFLLSLAMMVVMALPAFADSDVTTSGKKHFYSNMRGQYLNLEGNGAAYKNRNVTVYTYTNDDDQYWYIQNRGNGLKVYSAKSDAQGNAYALNMNTNTSNCNIYPDIVSNNSDSQVSTVGNESSFRISLARDAFYHVSIDSNSQNVTWGGTMDFTWSLR